MTLLKVQLGLCFCPPHSHHFLTLFFFYGLLGLPWLAQRAERLGVQRLGFLLIVLYPAMLASGTYGTAAPSKVKAATLLFLPFKQTRPHGQLALPHALPGSLFPILPKVDGVRRSSGERQGVLAGRERMRSLAGRRCVWCSV
ncbi:hypothetical protein NPIL_329181 [Nephila pilipes]|uniref:Uncharacterized protein n=1 Tax=Nephila pilipes TaxID=299642 RepID=A0A8X6QFU3_NEPPI|nr:hypothetical protein NPIL_329181 [Nephila pilipes]